ncbi:MAG: hypothetical protein PHD37_17215 [Gallionellaceae bacterium]|nr:hypothetical protein [Gallionellaceae bacterium]
MKQQLVEDSTTDQLELEVWDHNVQVVPTSALISIIIDGATDVSLAAATVTTAGTCTYIPGATVLSELAEDAVAEWKLTIDGEPKYFRQMFDIVRRPLHPSVTDEDLIAECAQLQEYRYMATGLADTGSSTSLVSILLKEFQDNHFQGGTLEIVAGACVGEKQRISGSVTATGTISLDTSLSTTIDSTSRFVARRTFQREIDRAWDDVQAMIESKGYRPALIMNSEDLRPAHLYWSLIKICRNLSRSPDDIWWKRSEVFDSEFQARLGMLQFNYDSDEDDWPDSHKSARPSLRR